MKILFCLLPLVIFHCSLYSQCNIARDQLDKVIDWSQRNKLNYDDFLSQQDTSFIINNRSANATAFTRIDVCFLHYEDSIPFFSVINRFYKDKSWMVEDTKSVLYHEQIHFNISEVFARKIRKELEALQRNGVTKMSDYKETIQNLLKERTECQNKYDHETDFGNLENEQNKWGNCIDKSLKDLKQFARVMSP